MTSCALALPLDEENIAETDPPHDCPKRQRRCGQPCDDGDGYANACGAPCANEREHNGLHVCEIGFTEWDQPTHQTWCPWWSDDPVQIAVYNNHSVTQIRGRREGLVVDTGATDNLSGHAWMDRQTEIAKTNAIDTTYGDFDRPIVGKTTDRAEQRAQILWASAVELCWFDTPVLHSEPERFVPGLWGLNSQQRRNLIDTGGNIPGPGGFMIQLSPGSRAIRCEHAVPGHMILPTSEFSKVKKRNENFKNRMAKQWTLYGTTGNTTDDDDDSTVPRGNDLLQ